ncbi:MAG: F0F1 ATP synthase subunit gamma [Parvularculales bacterium]
MPSLKELRNRIGSVAATRKITRAMQMVAVSKLRRAQEAAEAARPYAERMERVMTNLAYAMEGRDDGHPLMVGTGREDVHLLLVATADRGLCGGFNSSIARKARDHARSLMEQGRTIKIICIGKKGRDALKREMGGKIVDTVDFSTVKNIGFSEAKGIADRVLAMFEAGEFDVCTLFYSRFRSVIAQEPMARQIIPAAITGEDGEDSENEVSTALPPDGAAVDYEPDEEEILHALLPRNVAVQIFRALLENAASEQGARMTAMDNATRNAGEMIDKLTITYNRTRQAMITRELIEIISGAEAL